MDAPSVAALIGAGMFVGIFIGWCWRSFQFAKDKDCANPEHKQ